MNALKNLFRRFNSLLVMLPVQVALVVLGWVLFGALDSRVSVDNPFGFLLELPALCAYASAAIGFAALVKVYLLHDIPRSHEVAMHKAAAEGDKGARWLIYKDRIEWIVLLLLFTAFFWPAR